MDRLILHIGMHKTGSTAIQTSVANSARGLKQNGILYPVSARGPHPGHPHLPWQATGHHRFRPELGGALELVAEVNGAEPRVVIISSEGFCRWDEDKRTIEAAVKLVDALQPRSLQVIAYIRPQWEFMESLYVQIVKTGGTSLIFDEYVRTRIIEPMFDYHEVFLPWKEAFGDSVSIRPYHKNVVQDFWVFADLGQPPEVPIVNVRLGAKSVEICRVIREIVDRYKLKNVIQVRQAYSDIVKQLNNILVNDVPFVGLTDDIVQDVSNYFQPSNRLLSDLFLSNDMSIFDCNKAYTPTLWSLKDATSEELRLLNRMLHIATMHGTAG